MRTKKRWYFVWTLVFVMLVFAGCGKKTEPPADTSLETKDGQKEFVEKALKEIVKKMKSDGQKSNDKKIQRSLAKHILKDHVALIAHFQSQAWDDIVKDMGNLRIKVYKEVDTNGNPKWYEGDMKVFWSELYKDKVDKCSDFVSIELQIWADDILLADIDPKEDEKDCSSTEDFLFRIIALDENGNVICNQSGGGRIDRRHSGVCPWV